jgi:hypothetical protein
VHAWVYRRNWKEKVNSTEQYGGATDSIPLRLMQTADAEIKIALQTARLALQNSGNKGDHVEGAIRSILERFLPRNLYVGHGEVVDTLGVQSSQSDVVIANDLQPFRLASEVPGLYLVEGVSAVGEIKARLTTAELNDSIRKGTRSKSLRFRAHTGATVSSNTSDLERFYFSPPFFLVARGQWTQPRSNRRSVYSRERGCYQLWGWTRCRPDEGKWGRGYGLGLL